MIGTETLAEAASALPAQTRTLPGVPVDAALRSLAAAAGCRTPATRCAIETALLDLLAQDAGLPLAAYLRAGREAPPIAVNAALGSLLRSSDQAILAACAAGFGVLKFKVGDAPIADEIARLQAVAELLPAGGSLRLDANRAWCEADAARFLAACAALPVEMLEEPLQDPQPDALRRLQADCAVALALDESWANRAPENFFAAPPVRRLILKPTRLGGLLPAAALARRATASGLACVVTSSVDSACGIWAAAHLAAALDNGLAHGLATAAWLAEDIGAPPAIESGWLTLPATAGLGFVPQTGG